LFFEQQLQQAKDNLTAAEEAMTKTQQSTGVLQIDSQARALIESAAVLRAQVVAKQVQIEGMRSFATDDNPYCCSRQAGTGCAPIATATLAGSQNDTGSDINLSKGRVTQSGMEYLRRYRDSNIRRPSSSCWRRNSKSPSSTRRVRARLFRWWTLPYPDKKSSPHRT
jgi:tyrosine-protein kinase Etk/Wzc